MKIQHVLTKDSPSGIFSQAGAKSFLGLLLFAISDIWSSQPSANSPINKNNCWWCWNYCNKSFHQLKISINIQFCIAKNTLLPAQSDSRYPDFFKFDCFLAQKLCMTAITPTILHDDHCRFIGISYQWAKNWTNKDLLWKIMNTRPDSTAHKLCNLKSFSL